jgi:protocatechuate 3,4-dioxygenase beta subunit
MPSMPTLPPSPQRRRGVLLAAAGAALVAAPALHLRALAQAPARRLTPAQTEGPFYPVTLPADSDADLLANGALRYARGQAAWVEGTVSDIDGRPVRGAVVEIWQCDEQGHYHHPGDGDRADRAFQGFGKVAVDNEGRYRFRTIRPVAYGGRAPHIHVKVKLAARELLTTQLYVQGDAGNARDFLWQRLRGAEERAALTVPFVPGSDGLSARFPIVVAA